MATNTGYHLRNQEAKDYKQLSTLRLPRAKPVKNTDKLYELEVLEEDVYTSRVKVHYVGYDSEHDEWRDKADIVHLKTRPDTYTPFHLHNELAYQIKLSLRPSTRAGPDVRIELPFDRFLFIGGLQQVGKLVKSSRGHDIYTIRRYSTLDPLLGKQWHLRVLNRAKDFSYVILETVQYYLHRRVLAQDAIDEERSVDGGYLLIFRFVRGDGVERNWQDITAID